MEKDNNNVAESASKQTEVSDDSSDKTVDSVAVVTADDAKKSNESEPTIVAGSQKKQKKPKKHSSTFNQNVLILILVIVSLVVSGASLTFTLIEYMRGDSSITISDSNASGNLSSFVKEGSISDIATKVSAGVVSITTETRTTGWFGQTSTSSAAGTGMIVTADGYVLTNKHVVSDANKISIVMNDGTKYTDVSVATIDPLNDVAFLKINNVSDLPTVKLGDSKTIVSGQEVVAIGNALGTYSNSITYGIVSGTGRTVTATDSTYSSYETLTDLIQTDAAINAGNSGGPLINAAGEVIGINSATSGSGENIGFAIPIASVKGMLAQLVESGSASRTFLGVTHIGITPDVAESYDLPVVAGAYLYSSSGKYSSSAIQKGSPAAEAGLKDKDIITAVNGRKIGESGSLSTLIGEYKPGDTVQFTIIRSGKEMNLNVTLGAYKEE